MITSFDIEVINYLLHYCKLHKIPNKFTLASCLVYKNKKYGLATNDYYSTNPLIKKYNYPLQTLHSEASTIYKASKQLNVSKFKQSSLYITGVGRSLECNILKSSRPCKCCYSLITNFNIGRLVYVTSKDRNAVNERSEYKNLVINEEIIR